MWQELKTEKIIGDSINPENIAINKDDSLLLFESNGGYLKFWRKVKVYKNGLYRVEYRDTNGIHYREGKTDTIIFKKILWILRRVHGLKQSYKPANPSFNMIEYTLKTPKREIELGTLTDNKEDIPLELYNVLMYLNAF